MKCLPDIKGITSLLTRPSTTNKYNTQPVLKMLNLLSSYSGVHYMHTHTIAYWRHFWSYPIITWHDNFKSDVNNVCTCLFSSPGKRARQVICFCWHHFSFFNDFLDTNYLRIYWTDIHDFLTKWYVFFLHDRYEPQFFRFVKGRCYGNQCFSKNGEPNIIRLTDVPKPIAISQFWF